MLRVRTTPVFHRAKKVHVLDTAATVIGCSLMLADFNQGRNVYIYLRYVHNVEIHDSSAVFGLLHMDMQVRGGYTKTQNFATFFCECAKNLK